MWDIHPPDEGLDAGPSPSELERFEEARVEVAIAMACDELAGVVCDSMTLSRGAHWQPILKAAIRQAVEHEIADVLRRAQEAAA